jgi:hypothetical protein
MLVLRSCKCRKSSLRSGPSQQAGSEKPVLNKVRRKKQVGVKNAQPSMAGLVPDANACRCRRVGV